MLAAELPLRQQFGWQRSRVKVVLYLTFISFVKVANLTKISLIRKSFDYKYHFMT